MYEVIIITKYNTITLQTDDYNSPEMQEILQQPYVVSVEIHKKKGKIRSKKNEMARN